MDTVQGSQFTGTDWVTTLTGARVRVSMDGRGRYLDKILASPASGSSNAFGARSNMKQFTFRTSPMALRFSASR